MQTSLPKLPQLKNQSREEVQRWADDLVREMNILLTKVYTDLQTLEQYNRDHP